MLASPEPKRPSTGELSTIAAVQHAQANVRTSLAAAFATLDRRAERIEKIGGQRSREREAIAKSVAAARRELDELLPNASSHDAELSAERALLEAHTRSRAAARTEAVAARRQLASTAVRPKSDDEPATGLTDWFYAPAHRAATAFVPAFACREPTTG